MPVRWGVVMCDAANRRVLNKAVCYNEKNAMRRGRQWKRRHAANVVRIFSLLPGDTSAPIDVRMPGKGGRKKKGAA